MKRTILTLIAIALLSASISAQSTEERLPTNMRCPKGTPSRTDWEGQKRIDFRPESRDG